MPSKLGFHYLASGPDVAPLGLAVVKYCNCNPPVNQPLDKTTVFRWVENPDNINSQFGNSPEAAADAWVARQMPHIQHVPKYAYVEGPNENDCENATQANWYSRFEIARMKLMEIFGYKCVIGNFGTGRPSLPLHDPLGVDIWTNLLPMLRYAKANGHLLGLHEYGYTIDGWNMGRYRKAYDWLPEDARPELVITEWGLDGSLGSFGESRWRQSVSNPDMAYLDLVFAYDSFTRRDNYIRGFTLFTVNDDGHWGRFNIANQPIESMLLDYAAMEHSMAKFLVNQKVYITVTSGVNLLSEQGDKLNTASFNESGTISGGPRTIKSAQRWLVSFTNKAGWIDELFLSANPPPPASSYTERGKMKPQTHFALPLMRDPHTDSQIQNVNADNIVDGYLQYDRRPIFARGINWYHTNGLGVDGTRNCPEGWLPCRWLPTGKDFTVLEVYSSDGKPHPLCNQEITDVPPVVTPPVEPPPPVTPPPYTLPPATGTQLPNGGFESDISQPTPIGISGRLPDGWTVLWYATSVTPKLEKQDSNWTAPEIIANLDWQLTPDLKPVPEGRKVLHIFKGWGPTWVRMGTPKIHLLPGVHKLSAVIFFDPVAEYTTPKTYGRDPITAEFRMGLHEQSPDPFLLIGGFLNGNVVPYGQYRRLEYPITVTIDGDYTPYIEFRGRHGMVHNGLFVDDTRIDTGVVIPPVDPPDEPPDDDDVDVVAIRSRLDIIDELTEEIREFLD